MVIPKKSLGQHFLHDENIAKKIINALPEKSVNLLEIGPGTGILTKFLLRQTDRNLKCIETDREAYDFLCETYPNQREKFIHSDFLKSDAAKFFSNNYDIIGNFPYNISSQIFFKVLKHRNQVENVVCMIQKEVAERITSGAGSKRYGILSVLLQAFYDIRYLFSVSEHVFRPPPKVQSAVITLKRNENDQLNCNEKLFFRIVKTGFNQRRKTLRNSLKPLLVNKLPDNDIFRKRPEQLNIKEFVELTKIIEVYS